MSFAAPVLLLSLLLVPAAMAAYLWFDRRRESRAEVWASPALLPNMVDRPSAWRRHVPVALLFVGVALLLVGFARPRATINEQRQEATVILVLDVSGSMAANDSQPTRLAAARAAAEKYVDALPSGYQISVITFSDHSSVVVPPTHDRASVRAALARAKTGPQGTALASAVARAVAVAKTVQSRSTDSQSTDKGKRPPAVVVLFSDGGQTAGRIKPQQAAKQAKAAGIPVTAVGVGTPDGVVEQPVQGGYTERIQVPVQPAVLRTIASGSGSGGRYVAGARAVDVKQTFEELGSRVGHQRKAVEVTSAAAAGGLIFMLVGAVLSGAWFRRLV
ncbi:MAG TPA: VWA domain-containing protein [Gaiellaceae bacterium]